MLVFVGKEHHLADVRGYAYEHRLLAEKKLNRRLHPGECVHHLNGDKSDNRLENIVVMKSHAHHKVEHRKRHDLRKLEEENTTTTCACGCKTKLKKYDKFKRPRMFVHGHHRRVRGRR